jgi:tetratricopeptide (TPR) repeat protein
MQRIVAQEVAKELNAILTPDDVKSMMKIPTPDLTAYDFYLQGREEYTKYWLNGDSLALRKAELKYRQSLKYDPEFAEVYAELARVYMGKNLFKTYYSESFLDSVPILCHFAIQHNNKLADSYSILGDYYREKGDFFAALENYDKALLFNPNSWEPYFGKGTIYWSNDLVQCINNYQIAASLNHGHELAEILYLISHAYTTAGFSDKSLYYANQSLRLNGDSNLYTYNRFMAEIYAGNYIKASEQATRLLAMDSANIKPMTLFYIAFTYEMLGQHIQSMKYFTKLTKLSNPEFRSNPGSEHRIGYAYWEIGDSAKAYYYVKKALNNSIKQVELKRPMSLSYISYYDIAADYAFLGQRDSSFKYLRIFNQKPVMFRWFATYLKIDPLFKIYGMNLNSSKL